MKQRLQFVYRDDQVLVIDKPPGLPMLPDRFEPKAPNVLSIIRRADPEALVVHRIDRETSGVVVLALAAEAHRQLSMQFSNREVEKRYRALVVGSPRWDHRTVDLPLRPDADRRHRTRVDSVSGKPSATDLSVLERYDRHTFLECRPLTGRTHQIRVHLASVNLPIVADALYGDGRPLLLSSFKVRYTRGAREERPLISRMALHAAQLTFRHPATGDPVTFSAPLARDLNAAVRQLRKHGSALANAATGRPQSSI